MIEGGWDRSIARQAFKDDVPVEIIRRRTKGGMEESAQEILSRNLETARELLLDGFLVREGILDRYRVEEALSGRPTEVSAPLVELYDHLSVEAWLRTWSGEISDKVIGMSNQDMPANEIGLGIAAV